MLTNVLPALDRNRFTVSVICIGDESEFFDQLVGSGIDSIALGLDGKRRAIPALPKLAMHIRRLKPDVVITQLYKANVLGRIGALIGGGKRRVVWIHSSLDLWLGSPASRWTDRLLAHWTDAYFVVNEEQRHYLEKERGVPGKRIRVIPNGVDPLIFKVADDHNAVRELGIDGSVPVVAIVARLEPVKEHTTFLHAARLVLDDVPHAEFLIIGDGSLRTGLENLCAALRITDSVHFAGTRTDVAALLRGVDVLVLSSYTEGFPLAVLEGMASARPVVCTDVGGLREMVEDGVSGFLVPPRDPQQLATRLKELLLNPGLARRMGEAARHRIECQFALQRSVAATEQAITDVAAGTKRR